MKLMASNLSIPEIKLKPTSLEMSSAKIVPVPTEKVKNSGYRGYGAAINNLPKEIKDQFPYPSLGRSSGELQLLCDGNRNALEIKKMIDVQYPYDVELQDVLNYLEILKAAGLVSYK